MLLRAHAQHACQARCRQEHSSPHCSPQTEFPCRPNLRVPKRNICSLGDTSSAATSPVDSAFARTWAGLSFLEPSGIHCRAPAKKNLENCVKQNSQQPRTSLGCKEDSEQERCSRNPWLEPSVPLLSPLTSLK